jgi:hypothetical protein
MAKSIRIWIVIVGARRPRKHRRHLNRAHVRRSLQGSGANTLTRDLVERVGEEIADLQTREVVTPAEADRSIPLVFTYKVAVYSGADRELNEAAPLGPSVTMAEQVMLLDRTRAGAQPDHRAADGLVGPSIGPR